MSGSAGLLIVISGPSGVGKGTICKALIANNPNIVCSISATTRPKRKGEIPGTHYHFLTRDEFEAKIAAGEFLEWAMVYENYYGTLLAAVQEQRQLGNNVILEIDTVGGKQIKEKLSDALLIFIMPPDVDELEKRLRGRNTDSNATILKRLSCYHKEITDSQYYDYKVVNNNVEEAVAEIKQIVEERQKIVYNNN